MGFVRPRPVRQRAGPAGVDLRRPARSLVAAALSALTLAGAEAQTCFTMQAEMMHLQSQGVLSGADRDRYARAYREQANVLAQTEMRARNAGCFGSGFFLFRRAIDPSCRTLVPKLRDMQDNLARLDHLRRRGGRNVADRIQELQGMMGARGCDLPGNDFDNRGAGNFLYEPNTPYYSGNGTYRTLCVRTCDGYYFPISFSTTSEHLPEDAHSCEALCPGAEARLFYYSNPGGGPENMISVTGEYLLLAGKRLQISHQHRPRLHLPAGGRICSGQLFGRSGAIAAAGDVPG